jgi:hypothetical protein
MDWISAVEREGHALSLTARHNSTAEVPSCPGWNIDELLRHVGIAHHRAALILREGRTEPPPLEETSPAHGGSLSWYEAGLAALLDAMRTVDPATPVWTFSRSDPTATFWHRRMAHAPGDPATAPRYVASTRSRFSPAGDPATAHPDPHHQAEQARSAPTPHPSTHHAQPQATDTTEHTRDSQDTP